MESKKVKIGHRVYIEWLDSYAAYGWRDEIKEIIFSLKSIGIVVHNTDKYITISTSISTEGSSNSPLSIPWCSITKFKQYEKI